MGRIGAGRSLSGAARLSALHRGARRADASSIGSAPVPRFLRPGSDRALPVVACLESTVLLADRSYCRPVGAQSRPGADCEPARRNRTRSTFQVALRTAALH